MSQPTAQRGEGPDERHIRRLVGSLFRAENGSPAEGDLEAGDILAPDYLPITRAKGQVDASREDTVGRIANPAGSLTRHVDRAAIDVTLFMDGRVAVARTLLPTTDGASGAEASYRNMQVFLKREDGWKCVAWQVTRVQ